MKTLLTKFESTVREKFLAGERDQGRAILSAIRESPDLFEEFSEAGQRVRSEVFEPPVSSVTLFERRVKTHLGAGVSEGKAIILAAREDKHGYNLWRVREGA